MELKHVREDIHLHAVMYRRRGLSAAEWLERVKDELTYSSHYPNQEQYEREILAFALVVWRRA